MINLITGKSASGKDTLLKMCVAKNGGYVPVISCTTRPKRDGEVDGIDYFFFSDEEFEKKVNSREIFESREYHTINNGHADVWKYGSLMFSPDPNKEYIAVVDLEGAASYKRVFDDLCRVFFIDTPDEIRKERAMSRGSFDLDEWNRRAADDEIKFSDEALLHLSAIRIKNNGSTNDLYDRFIATDKS